MTMRMTIDDDDDDGDEDGDDEDINYFVATSHTYEAYHAGMLSCCNRYVHEGTAGRPPLLADNSTFTYGIGWGPRLAKQPGTATTGIALRWKYGVRSPLSCAGRPPAVPA